MRDFPARLGRLLSTMARQAGQLRLPQTASSLSLLTLMAVVPMAAAGLTLLTALPAFGSMREDVQRFLADNLFLPSFSETIVRYIEEFVDAAGRLSAIGTIAFLATALAAMLTVDRTLNGIWRTPRPRPLAQRLALYWSMLTLGPVLLGGTLALRVAAAERLTGRTGGIDVLAAVLPSLLAITVLTLLYRLAPNERVRWRHAFLGALAAAALLEGLRSLLGVYFALFPSYTVVYGAFAALPLFLVWLFALWMAVLIGALVAAGLRFWAVPLGRPHEATPAAEFARMVRVVGEVVRAAPGRVPSARFRPDFDGDAVEADRVASLLSAQGYLVRVWPVASRGGPAGVWDEWWLPAPGLGERTLRPLFDRVWLGHAERRAARRPVRSTDASVDPGGAALSRPIAEVLGAPDAAAPDALEAPGPRAPGPRAPDVPDAPSVAAPDVRSVSGR
ncbi:MAG TPA: YihY family inner membrane protein [Burkholderiaceae bacterium]|nr:YihY family inner membrane protein [Burkholderiaceae bacterium]